MNSLQEKFQTILPGKEEGGEGWASFESTRKAGNAGSMHAFGAGFNELPPGGDIANQSRARISPMALSLSGKNDVSADTNNESLRNGFTRRAMRPTDDVYTGEHVDHFYGEAVGDDGNVGFAERNNYLDRE